MKTLVEAQLISRSVDVLSGTPVFAGTRVPIRSLVDYFAGGHTLDEFLDDFPTVPREQAVELLNRINEMLRDAEI